MDEVSGKIESSRIYEKFTPKPNILIRFKRILIDFG